MMCPFHMTIEDKVKTIIANRERAPYHTLTRETLLLNDLGVDSIESIELGMALEIEFKIDIPADDVEGLKTIGELIIYLEGRMKK